MRFNNCTPFPAIGWPTIDNKSTTQLSMVVRVKYLFDTVDQEGFWSLKLDPEQGELFGQDIFYNEDNIHYSSVRFESDNVSYKPHADLVVNAYAHANVPLEQWQCGVSVLRPSQNEEQKDKILIEKRLTVRGEREIQDDLVGFSFTKSKESQKVAIRYENANGGVVHNPKYSSETEASEERHLVYNSYNPVGVGVTHKVFLDKDETFNAPQIESMTEPLEKPNMSCMPQGFGFIGRSWKPRIDYAGTFDEKWIKEKQPIMPDDFQEQHNNAAHPDLQINGYFEPYDRVTLHNLVKDRYVQSFEIPNFHFKGSMEDNFKVQIFYLDIDTVIVDILDDDMQKNALYISYRARIPASLALNECKLNMVVPKDFLGAKHGG